MALKTTTNGPKRNLPTVTHDGKPANTRTQMQRHGERVSHGSGPTFSRPEPIHWSIVGVKNEGNRWRLPNGRIEKRPAVAHTSDGDYTNLQIDPRTTKRFVRMVDAYGHQVFHTLSNGAAHVVEHDGRWSRDLFCQHQLDKGRMLGWFSIEPGECLVRLIRDGFARADKVLVKHEGVCKVGTRVCKHATAERAALL